MAKHQLLCASIGKRMNPPSAPITSNAVLKAWTTNASVVKSVNSA
jgi:hypothetical protein